MSKIGIMAAEACSKAHAVETLERNQSSQQLTQFKSSKTLLFFSIGHRRDNVNKWEFFFKKNHKSKFNLQAFVEYPLPLPSTQTV